jgi:type IV pilus assembly protein PilW
MKRQHFPSRVPPALQSGFSLVELMISIVIGLVILAAMVALFVNSSGSNREMARANSLIENGRLAIELLESDVVHAGYWGAYMPHFDDQTNGDVPDDVPNGVPDPCLAYNTPWSPTDQINLLHVPVNVYDSDAVCAGVVVDKKAADTDVLVVRHAELCEAGSGGNCEDLDPAAVYFQSTRCSTDLARFRLGSEDDGTVFNLNQMDCATLSERRKFISNIYYVREWAVTAGDGIPTLVRSSFNSPGGVPEHQPAVAMIEGIEGFRVELGIDDRSKAYAGEPDGTPVDYTAAVEWLDPDTRTIPTNRGDGSPDGAFVECTTAVPCTVDQLVNVTAVKIYVLVRSREPTQGYTDAKTYQVGTSVMGPFNDGFKRHVYVSTLRLPNVAGRRQTP